VNEAGGMLNGAYMRNSYCSIRGCEFAKLKWTLLCFFNGLGGLRVGNLREPERIVR
jgi:hypothetical protein